MRGSRISSFIIGAALLGFSTISLSAAPIFGTFNIAGTINVTATTITWNSNDAPFTPDLAKVGPGPTGSFVGLAGQNVTTADFNRITEPVGPPGFPDQPFITFPTMPALGVLDINFIYKGIYSNALCATLPATVGQTCTPGPPDSPFNFVNNPPPAPSGPQATATFVFTGETADHLSTVIVNFTSQFDVPYQTILAEAFGPGGSGVVSNTYSATVTVIPNATVPEPGPMALSAFGIGLVLFSALLRRRRNQRCN